jgi:protein-disulfide isomerase
MRIQMTHKKMNDPTTGTNPTEAMKKAPENLRWILSVLTILGIVAIVIFLSRVTPDENQSADSASPLRAIGPETAEVTITEFADFGCISCKAWHQFGVREEILNQYGEQVRFVWRDFPVTTRHSLKAAEAGFCAQDQDRFWEYHDVLYENAPALAVDHLKAYAEGLGLNANTFNQCLDSGKYQQAVENELAEAKELGLRGVPSFIVNGKRLVGPPSFEQLAAIIDEILAAQE